MGLKRANRDFRPDLGKNAALICRIRADLPGPKGKGRGESASLALGGILGAFNGTHTSALPRRLLE